MRTLKLLILSLTLFLSQGGYSLDLPITNPIPDYFRNQEFKTGTQIGIMDISGRFFSLHQNGQIESKGHIVNGKHEGAWHYWYSDGTTMAQGQYSKGEQEGEWLYTVTHVVLVSSVKVGTRSETTKANYKNGKLERLTSFYENGKKHEEVHYKDGKEESKVILWDKNVQIATEGNCKDGVCTWD